MTNELTQKLNQLRMCLSLSECVGCPYEDDDCINISCNDNASQNEMVCLIDNLLQIVNNSADETLIKLKAECDVYKRIVERMLNHWFD